MRPDIEAGIEAGIKAGIMGEVRAAVAAVAPECDAARLAADRPLREQVALDSLDWMNLVDGLAQRLGLEPAGADPGRLATIDDLVAWLATACTQARSGMPVRAARDPHALFARTHRLADGTVVRLRPLEARDVALEASFVAQLSPESRRQRFMTAVRELPQRKLEQLTDVDGVRHVALVATTARNGRELPLGVARYIVDDAGSACEFAIVVSDDCRDTGLAGLLMGSLIGLARDRGLARMEGEVLADNHAMLRFARQLGFHRQAVEGDARVVRVVRELQHREPVTHSATPAVPAAVDDQERRTRRR